MLKRVRKRYVNSPCCSAACVSACQRKADCLSVYLCLCVCVCLYTGMLEGHVYRSALVCCCLSLSRVNCHLVTFSFHLLTPNGPFGALHISHRHAKAEHTKMLCKHTHTYCMLCCRFWMSKETLTHTCMYLFF